MSIRAGVVGATGYAGAELVRILSRHPKTSITKLTSQSKAGKPAIEAAPQLRGLALPELERLDVAELAYSCDVVFLAQESGFAMREAPAMLASGLRVIDLSADFRLRDPAAYPAWYGFEHESPGLLEEALYGLPELVDRDLFGRARLVANPGCYPTGAALALAPLVRAGTIEGTPVIDAKSGVSGAGRSRVSVEHLFTELNDSFTAYKPTAHRHIPEIEQSLGVPVRFTPHLVPMSRGIFTTVHAKLRAADVDVEDVIRQFYEGAAFVQVLERGQIPATKHVHGSNSCHIAAEMDARTGYAVIFSVIDNLVKGAAGQAAQNMNLMFGLSETCGLDVSGVFP